MSLHITETPAPHTDDDFLFDDGLPCLRRDGRLYYLGDMQPRVLEACRHFEIGFDQLAEKLGMTRPAMVLILKGYDSVTLQLKSMIDRLLDQAGQLPLLPIDYKSQAEPAASDAAPIVTTIHAVPVPDAADDDDDPDAAITVTAEDAPELIIPATVAPGRPAMVAPALPPAVFAPGLSEFTPGLRRAPFRRNSR
ncbi:MAG: hypothetical protein VW600_11750 [Ferrovibrio sp.]